MHGATQEEQENRGPCEDRLALSQGCAELGGSLGVKDQPGAQVAPGDREPQPKQSTSKSSNLTPTSSGLRQLLPLAMDDVIGSRWRLGFSAAGASGDASGRLYQRQRSRAFRPDRRFSAIHLVKA